MPIAVDSPKAGLAAPAVLGTLASRRVLGADYYCTTSGQTSGNTSTHGEDVGCDIAGALPPTGEPSWAITSTWPIDKSNAFNGLTINGTVFPDVFYKKEYDTSVRAECQGWRLVSSSATGKVAATLFEILTLRPSCDEPPSEDLLELGRAVIATILNASQLEPTFPINQQTAMSMFNDVYLGGSYEDEDWQNKNASWNAADVLCYFRLLYGEVTGCSGLTTGALAGTT